MLELTIFIIFATTIIVSPVIAECSEYIDYGFSLYTINHTVYPLGAEVITIGIGSSDIGTLPTQLYIRVYNYNFIKFPTEIYRNANGNFSNLMDQYLVFENIIP